MSTELLTRCRDFPNVWKKHGPSPWIPTAIELSGVASWGLLPLPARNEWGEGWGEGNSNKNGPPLPDPLLPLWGGEGEFLAASPVLFLNSMAVGIKGEGPCFFHTLRESLHR